uniref:DUF1758 domain-containing protein n=1 Tax=Heterorhabditis bacteriophora TaxID=37862 RepID=A0A1I7WSC7_HETBA
MNAYIRSRITRAQNQLRRILNEVRERDEELFAASNEQEATALCEGEVLYSSFSKMIDYIEGLIELLETAEQTVDTLQDKLSGITVKRSMITTSPTKNSTTQVVRETIQSPPEINRTMMTLPQTKLSKFDGTGEWKTYWQAFEAMVDSRHDLPMIRKLSYLLSTLEEKAASAVAGFDVIQDNYEPIKRTLKERFGNEQKIKERHIRKLLSLRTEGDSVEAARKMSDQMEAILLQLKSCGMDTESVMIRMAIERAIPHWMRHHIFNAEMLSKTWSVAELADSIKKVVSIDTKVGKLKESKACIKCLQIGHRRSRSRNSEPKETALMTIEVILVNMVTGNKVKALAFFDSGAEMSFITEMLATALDLKRSKEKKMNVNTFHEENIDILCKKCTIGVSQMDGTILPLQVRCIPTIVDQMKVVKIPSGIQRKINTIKEIRKPSLIIGIDYYWSIIEKTIINSTVGQMVSGGAIRKEEKAVSCPIPMTSETEKAFLQLGLNEKYRHVLRFMFPRDWNKPVEKGNIIIYRFKRVNFGVISSPFLLAGTLKVHLEKTNTTLDKEILRNTYVDNVLLEADSYEEALQKVNQAKEKFEIASMNLRELISSDPNVNAQWKVKPAEPINFLGIKWEAKRDSIWMKIPRFNLNEPTKRNILRQTAAIFDPLGFLKP